MSPPIIWLIAGVALCLMEAVLPTAFIALTMGMSAILVGLLAVLIPQLGIQVALWLLLSVVLLIVLRRLLPRRPSRILEDSREALTLTEILPGKLGRVRYEGNSWQAYSEADRAIAPDQTVMVIGRRGTTLIVTTLPQIESWQP